MASESVSPLPEKLPGDIGLRRYVVIGVDKFLPADAVDQSTFGLEAEKIGLGGVLASSAAKTHHFLFGAPGVSVSLGRFLYHYTSLESLELIRQSRSLRLSANSTKNDPLESRPWEGVGLMYGMSQLGQSPTLEVRDNAMRHLSDLDALRLRTLAISFATDSPNSIGKYSDEVSLFGYSHPSMWAHYGADHSGACIVLDRHAFDLVADMALSAIGDSFGQSVTYTNQLVELVELSGYYVEGETGSPREDLIARRGSHLFSKHPVWASEAEYRWVCIPQDGSSHALVGLGESIIGLVLGDQTNISDARISAFVEDFGISANVAQCGWSSPFQLDVDLLDDFSG